MALVRRNQFGDFKKEIEAREESNNANFKDDRFIVFKPGNTYRFRLLFDIDETVSSRKEPFIYQYVHHIWDAEAKKGGTVICPSSPYIMGRNGFNICPNCIKASQLYKDAKENKSKTSKIIYNKVKRKYSGYGIVYVISDPSNAENNGHAKLIRFGSEITAFLKKEIFGIIENKKGEDENAKDPSKKDQVMADLEPIGSAAFDLEAGYDLIITVSTAVNPEEPEKKYNSYSPKFSREKSALKIDLTVLETEIKALNFDKDFYKESTKEELNNFFKEFVMDEGESATDAPAQTFKPSLPSKKNLETASEPSKTADPKKVVTSNELTNSSAKPEDKKPEVKAAPEAENEAFDVDQLLADLDKK